MNSTLRQAPQASPQNSKQNMQTIELILETLDFYCPATGQQILSAEGCQPSPATLAVWAHEAPEDPDMPSPWLKTAWDSWTETVSENEELEGDIAAFIQSNERPSCIAFQITTYEAGSLGETVSVVIDMDVSDSDA